MARLGEIERLRSRMRQHHFVAISGPRNCGKSRVCRELKQSLEREVKNMREVDRKFKAKAGMRWKVAYIKLSREDNPFDLLTKALAGPTTDILVDQNEKVDPLFESHIKAVLMRPDGTGLLEIYQRFLRTKQLNFLLIVDQFENLFFSTLLTKEEKHLFVNLLLNSSLTQRQLYVTVALRPPKADLWKQNFRNLNDAVESCKFRLYAPNQVDLGKIIEHAFMLEKDNITGKLADTDLLRTDWLNRQEIYQKVALKRVRMMAEDLGEILKSRWVKILKSGTVGSTSMVESQQVANITKQLRGIVDVIWPQLLHSSNIGNLDAEDREDLVDDLKGQLTDVLTIELLRKLSRILAEELYFEAEPLTQIERNVRQLMRDWADVLQHIRAQNPRRRREIQTVTLEEQRGTSNAVSGNYRVDTSGPIQERAEKAYIAMRTSFEKRIAKKSLMVLGRTASISGKDAQLSLDSVMHAVGRFASRIPEILEVFVQAGVLECTPPGALTHDSMLCLADDELVETWPRMKEWIYGPELTADLDEDGGFIPPASRISHGEEAENVSLDLPEIMDGKPENILEMIERAESVYKLLRPSLRKRATQRLFVQIAIMTQATSESNPERVAPSEVYDAVGRFEDFLKEMAELFTQQGILDQGAGGIKFEDPLLAKHWERLATWLAMEREMTT